MQITSRFTVALHIFTCVEVFKDDYKVTSDFLAGSINTNPVIIRKILTQLKNADLITIARGTGGITVNRPLSEVTFYDVYQAIDMTSIGILGYRSALEHGTPQEVVDFRDKARTRSALSDGTSIRCLTANLRRRRALWKTS